MTTHYIAVAAGFALGFATCGLLSSGKDFETIATVATRMACAHFKHDEFTFRVVCDILEATLYEAGRDELAEQIQAARFPKGKGVSE